MGSKEQSKLKISVVSVCLGVYFIMMPFDCFSMFGIGSLLRIIALLPIGAIVLIKLRVRVQINPLTVSFLIYCLSLFVTCFYSIDQIRSFQSVLRILLNMGVILCIGGMYDYNQREIEFLEKALVIGGIATLVLTVIFSDFSDSGRLTLNINGDSQDQNYLNGYIFFTYTFFLSSLFKKKNIFMFIPVVCILFFTLMTGSRGALLALIGISMVVLISIFGRKSTMKLSIFLGFGIGVLLLLLLYQPILALLPEAVGKRFSLEYIAQYGNTGRSAIWSYLLQRFSESSILRMFFGYGYGTVVLVNEYNHLVAHNLWLDHLIMGGLVGEVVFVGMQVTFFRAVWKSKDIILIGSYVGYLIMMMLLSLLSYKPFWNCMMMIMIVSRYQQNQAVQTKSEVNHES